MGLLSRQELLKKEKLQIERVELGGEDHVYVRQMTGRERDRFEQSLMKEVKDGKGNVTSYERSLEDFRAKLAVNTLCDDKGKNLLEPGDYQTLSQHMSAAKLEKIVNVAQSLNKIADSDKEAMIKNSGGGQTADSTSDSA